MGDSKNSGLLHKNLSQAEYLKLSKLLDESVEMEPRVRDSWLDELARNDPQSAAVLRELFASQDASQADDVLETRDFLSRRLGPAATADAGLAGKTFGPYRVLSLLGHGGMASVWLAERIDGVFTRRVALKLVQPLLMGGVVTERLARERQILAGLNHPNIARLFDAGFTEDGQPYLALEYVVGTPLSAHCDEHRLPIPKRLELFLQVLSAVQYAHANLVIHRDLKPSNILVTQEGQVELLDFGIAKLLGEAGEAKETELTQLGGRALTPDYAAPEQIAGLAITTGTDVYAAGVMLYELLTGERPYRLSRESRGVLEEAILRADPLPPSRAEIRESAAQARGTTAKRLAKALKGDLDAIVLKALKKLPAERYSTASAFGEDIGRYLRGEVVLAQRDSVAYRTLKFARRHWVGLTVGAVLAATLAGGLATTAYEARLASTQRDVALQAQVRSLTQTAAARLKEFGASSALAIVLELLQSRSDRQERSYAPEALSVFQEACADDAQVIAVTGHSDRVRWASFSPDGQRVVTASYDKTARIWDARTGRELKILGGHVEPLIAAVFSPDGRHVVTASFDKSVRIWDAETGAQLSLLAGHTDRLRALAISPDGRWIATGSYDRTARIWDASTGREIKLLSGHSDVLTAVAFSPDRRHIVTASYDKTARIWDMVTGRQIQVLRHADRVTSAAYSPDGTRIVTGSGDKIAHLWDAATGAEILRLIGHSQLVASAAFSPDGRSVVTGSYDGTARIWNTATGKTTRTLSGHTDAVESVAFSADGRRVVTSSSDGTFRVWDAAPTRLAAVLSGHADQLPHAAFSADGKRVVTASFDGTARIWDTASARELVRLSGHTGRVISAEFSTDGRRVVTASLDRTARIWDAATGRELTQLRGHTDAVFSAAFSPDDQRVVTTSLDKTARVWDAETGREVRTLRGHTAGVSNAVFSSDSKRIVTASSDKSARIWDASTGRQLVKLSGHTDPVERVDLSADGESVVTASDDRTARIWDTRSGLPTASLVGHNGSVTSAQFSMDGRRVVTSSEDRTARVWDAATGRQLLALKDVDVIERAVFSPDGRRVLTAGDDFNARLWDAVVPALDIQIEWAKAAQFDLLSSQQRYQLGLPASEDVARRPVNRSRCDEAAASPYDPDRRAPGAMLDQIDTDVALEACMEDARVSGSARSLYQSGRAQYAGGDLAAAAQSFEAARAAGYRAAQVDLAMLLSMPASGKLDIPRAISLYEQAWSDGVTIAGFELGALYERGVEGGKRGLAASPEHARRWYRQAADAGDPHALAWFGERADQAAALAQEVAQERANFLEAFKYYAAACARARAEEWPEEMWRAWRYRRASLARLLQREGMEREVAEAYDAALATYTPPPMPSFRARLASFVTRY